MYPVFVFSRFMHCCWRLIFNGNASNWQQYWVLLVRRAVPWTGWYMSALVESRVLTCHKILGCLWLAEHHLWAVSSPLFGVLFATIFIEYIYQHPAVQHLKPQTHTHQHQIGIGAESALQTQMIWFGNEASHWSIWIHLQTRSLCPKKSKVTPRCI